ncbi:MAG: hypothetical protein RLZ33_713 [Bacteroidota bacterium]
MKENWLTKRLDDVCRVEYGTRVVQKKDGGTIYPVYGGGGATFFMDSYNRENCLVIARFAMSAKCTRFVKDKFFLNDSGLTICPKNDDEILMNFLNLQILYLNDHIYSLSRGTAQRNLDVSAFRNIEINYPKSLKEQQHIVAILDEAFAAIDQAKANIEKNIQNAKELFQSKLNEVFSQQREDWEIVQLGELASFRNGMNFSKNGKGEKIKIVGVRDFQNGFYVPNDSLSEVILDGSINDIDLLKEGDIIAVRSNGNPQLIGRTLLAKNITGKVCHSGFTIRIRLNSNKIEPEYLCQFLKIQETRKKLVESGNGVGIKSLNQGSLSNLLIPFPKSTNEQLKIKKNLDFFSEETKKLEVNFQNKLENLDELKKSLLQKAFAGELKLEKVNVA